MYRLRNALNAIYYTLIKNSFSIKKGCLYIEEKRLAQGNSKHGVYKIPLGDKL